MAQVDIRANIPVLGLRANKKVYGVEKTPLIERVAEDGKITILAEYPDPEDGAVGCEPAAAEGSHTAGPAEPIALAAGRPMTDAEAIAAGGEPPEVDD